MPATITETRYCAFVEAFAFSPKRTCESIRSWDKVNLIKKKKKISAQRVTQAHVQSAGWWPVLRAVHV